MPTTFDDQLSRMRSLMTYGKVNEDKNVHANCTLEYHEVAADGNTYGIVRECNKYYIKRAESGKELVAESYNYLGGFNNKKDYEYFSYAKALDNFMFKMNSIKEACEGNVNITTLNPFRKNIVLAEGTSDEMRNEIARQRQLMYNTCMLMNESTQIGATPIKNQPESEHANSGDEDAPFTETAKVDMDFDGAKPESIEKSGDPFDKGEKGEKAESYKNVQVGNSVAGMKPTGGKVVRVNESVDEKMFNAGLPAQPGVGTAQDEKFVEGAQMVNEEDEDFGSIEDDELEGLDSESEFGHEDVEGDEDFEGIDDNSEEDIDIDGGEDLDGIDDGTNGDEDFGGEQDIDIEGDEDLDGIDEEGEELDETDPESVRAEIERLQSLLDDMEDGEYEDGESEDIEDDLDTPEEHESEELAADEPEIDNAEDLDKPEESGDEMVDEESEELPDVDEPDFENIGLDEPEEPSFESKKEILDQLAESVAKTIKEEQLHVFGKHPGYRKKPMQLPTTGEDKNQWGEDWNDESVHSEAPFGEKIGDGSPFNQQVEKLTNEIMEQIKSGKISFIKKK